MNNKAQDKFSFLKGKLLSSIVYPEFFKLSAGDYVLNLGCGEGPQAIIYKDQFAKMIGVDINKERLARSAEAMKIFGVKNYETINSKIEQLQLPKNYFNKVLAIDIIEHVQDPHQLLRKAYQLLKPGGTMLITFPVRHDKFTKMLSAIKRIITFQKKKKEEVRSWDPDSHNTEHGIKEWLKLISDHGFKLLASRASTLFPPLHLYGFPRFWFKIKLIHKLDSFLCNLPVLKKLGQSFVCIFKKIDKKVKNEGV